MQWRGTSLSVMSGVFSLVVAGGHSLVLACGHLSHCGQGLLLSFGIGPISSSGGGSGLLSSYTGAFFGSFLWEGCSLSI